MRQVDGPRRFTSRFVYFGKVADDPDGKAALEVRLSNGMTCLLTERHPLGQSAASLGRIGEQDLQPPEALTHLLEQQSGAILILDLDWMNPTVLQYHFQIRM